MPAGYNTAILYGSFAALATMANISAQEIAIRAYSGTHAITLSILLGTAAGLALKYHLDKRYIFQFQTRSITHNSQTFALYTLMGILTTAIFWAFEISFHHLFQTKEMRYAGGVLGLATGYVIKFHLDRKFVFRANAS